MTRESVRCRADSDRSLRSPRSEANYGLPFTSESTRSHARLLLSVEPSGRGWGSTRSSGSPQRGGDRTRVARSAACAGPITVFIHHNTLHAFESLPFHEAVKKGAQVFGCQPYLTEDRYREALGRGRIRFDEPREVLEKDLGDRANEAIPGVGTRLALRLAMLQYPLRSGPTEELLWYVAETNALRRVRREASSAIRARMIAETRRLG